MESISKVEEAESYAKELTEKADQKSRKMLDDASSKAREILESASKKTGEQRTARINAAIKKLEAENKKAAAAAQREAAKMRGRKVKKEVLARLAGNLADLILGE
jgi:vacuolar-type H+-ATPase subunit H